MKQVLQSLRDGSTTLADVPAPGVTSGHLLIRTTATLVSAGTERMLVEFGAANWLQKARQQPDKVRMVLNKIRTDGLLPSLDAVRSKLDQPLALGYCNVGIVLEAGPGVVGFKAGDRVVSNGKHAELVRVPANLCALLPEAVNDEEAAFTVLAAIGLQGIRLVNPTMGECVVVTGLGLIGLLTVQMLRAQGCRVLGLDFDPQRLAMAQAFGADVLDAGSGADVVAHAMAFSRGRGVDAVIITASTTSNEPVAQAAKMCRKRGRIVLVGVTGLQLSRADFYEKELSFQVSCSYGPGRYDSQYEERGQDYPIGFVRWTEQRNFEAVIDLLAAGSLKVAPLVSHRFALADVKDAYALLTSGADSLGILLQYPSASSPGQGRERTIALSQASPATINSGSGVIVVGAGNYAGRTLIPAFKAAGARAQVLVSSGGTSAAHHGRKNGFEAASTDFAQALQSDAASVVIATRHDAHAGQVLAALGAGKHVFCEKPLCLTHEELGRIHEEALSRPNQVLMVGFNRRFSPHVRKMESLLATLAAPRAMVMTVNAGAIPADHWTQDLALGGGRIVGEGCHFIDLLRHLAGAPVSGWEVNALSDAGMGGVPDSASISLKFLNGSIGTVHYLANGAPAFAKERLEVFCAGRILQLDNFRRLRGWGWPGFSRMGSWRQDKGQTACVAAFMDAVRNGTGAPIPLAQIIESSRLSIDSQRAMA